MELLMKRYLSLGWSQKRDCTFKQVKKGLDALAPPDSHYSRRNAQWRFRHGREAFVVLFVRKNYGAITSDGAHYDVMYKGYAELREVSEFFNQPYIYDYRH